MTDQLRDADGEPYTLLIIDDDDVARMAVQRALGKIGIDNRAEHAADGLAAIEQLERGVVPPPRLLLLDLSMPRLDGIGLLERLRENADAALRAVPVVVITTSTSGSELERVRSLGAVAIEKGRDMRERLESAIREVLE